MRTIGLVFNNDNEAATKETVTHKAAGATKETPAVKETVTKKKAASNNGRKKSVKKSDSAPQ